MTADDLHNAFWYAKGEPTPPLDELTRMRRERQAAQYDALHKITYTPRRAFLAWHVDQWAYVRRFHDMHDETQRFWKRVAWRLALEQEGIAA